MQEIKKPNFLIIGAPKAGTTSLWHLLRQHPDIFMPDPKEPGYFCFENVYKRGAKWYESLFEKGRDKTAVGEATTPYSKTITFPWIVERIATYNPAFRLIYIVRHPLERMESNWKQALKLSRTTEPFRLAIRNFSPIIENSRYWHHLESYRRYFKDDQILLLFFEDFKRNPQATLNRCFRFLNIKPEISLSGMDKQQNVSADFSMDPPWTAILKSMPFKPWRILPKALRENLRKKLRVRIPTDANWDKETKRWAIQQVGEDARKILKYGGKPSNYWKLND